jgi:lysophospholipase L1-like esterase
MARAAAISSGIAVGSGIVAADQSTPAGAVSDNPAQGSAPASTPAVVELVAVTTTVGPGSTGIYAPSDWGKTGGWATARAAASSRPVNVVVLGDSIGEGYWSSNLLTKGFVGATINSLRTAYGDGGSGFHSTVDTPGLSLGNTCAMVYSTTGGTWSLVQAGMNDVTATGPGLGATLTNPSVSGTTVDVYYDTSCGSFTVTIDGHLAGTVTGPTNPLAIGQATFSGLAAGVHQVTITQSSSTACAIMGIVGRNATGIVGWNMSRWGRTAAPGSPSSLTTHPAWIYGETIVPGLFASLDDLGAVGSREVIDCVTTNGSTTITSATAGFSSSDVGALVYVPGVGAGSTITSVLSATRVVVSAAATASASGQVLMIYGYPGFAQIPKTSVPDLFIGELGGNDAAAGISAATYIGYVNAYMNLARQANPLCDIVWILTPLNGGQDPDTVYYQYARELRCLCETYGAMLIDLYAMSRNTPATWSAAGYMGDGLADGLAGSDKVHWSDAGHAFVSKILTSLLTA